MSESANIFWVIIYESILKSGLSKCVSSFVSFNFKIVETFFLYVGDVPVKT